MKTILTVATIAAILATALPAQAEEDQLVLNAPLVSENARAVKPGNTIEVRGSIHGRPATIKVTGPSRWMSELSGVKGDFVSLPFPVQHFTPSTFELKVEATWADGKKRELALRFVNVGAAASSQVAQAAPPAIAAPQAPTPQAVAQPSQVAQLRHSIEWVSPQLDGRGTQSQSSATATTVWSLTGTPVRFGAQLRLSPFDPSAKNSNGKDGLAPFIGLGGNILPGWEVEGNLGLTANPWSGGLSSWPMQLTLRSEAELPYGFRNISEAHSDFGSVGGFSRLSWALDSADGMAFGPFAEIDAQKEIGQYYGRTIARAGVENEFRLKSGHQARLTLGYSWAHNDWSNGILAGLELRPSKTVIIESKPNEVTPAPSGTVVRTY